MRIKKKIKMILKIVLWGSKDYHKDRELILVERVKNNLNKD